VTDLALDPKKSRVRIHTFAEGLFARLAHDLELSCTRLEGTATRDGKSGTARIEAPLGSIAVAGVLKGDRVDDRSLSPGDRYEILERMQDSVFHVKGDARDVRVVVEATFDGETARVKLKPPRGPAYETTVKVSVTDDRASGSFELSLSAIGSDPVKGPMGAFRMKDRVVVVFDVAFAPAQPA
jgi:hypothetical protein